MATHEEYTAAANAILVIAHQAVRDNVPGFFQSDVPWGTVTTIVNQAAKASVDAAEGARAKLTAVVTDPPPT